MPNKQPGWMDEEETRANQVAETGKTSNPNAPQLVRVTRQPSRKQKPFYLQESYIETFDDFVHEYKKGVKGNPAPQLIEEALRLLFEKYGVNTSKL
ncbi:MAG: hypothetical protein ISR74_06605 [Candidatus Thioglobus sp.]|jgi:hypothetical protein|nr:hypothetical protein [Candidatus Thioglobus sp.]